MAAKNDNIMIAFYRNFTRIRVLKIPLKVLRLVIIINSILIIFGVIFSLSFLYQWAVNEELRQMLRIMKKEKSVVKEDIEMKQGCSTQSPVSMPRPEDTESSAKTDDTGTEEKSPVSIDEVKFSVDKASSEFVATYTIQNINQGGDLISGYLVTVGISGNTISTFPPVVNFKGTGDFISFDRGEKFSVRVYRKSVSKLPLLPDNKVYEKVSILVYSLDGELLESRSFNVGEYIKY